MTGTWINLGWCPMVLLWTVTKAFFMHTTTGALVDIDDVGGVVLALTTIHEAVAVPQGVSAHTQAPMCFFTSSCNPRHAPWQDKHTIVLARVAISGEVVQVSPWGAVSGTTILVHTVCTAADMWRLAMGRHTVEARTLSGFCIGRLHLLDGFECAPDDSDHPSLVTRTFAHWAMPHAMYKGSLSRSFTHRGKCSSGGDTPQQLFPAVIQRDKTPPSFSTLDWWMPFDYPGDQDSVIKLYIYDGQPAPHGQKPESSGLVFSW
jgi:hypothetical protein